MKRFFHASTLLFGSLLSAGSLAAGSFSIPFEFEASGRLMPAGSYQVERTSVVGSAFRLRDRATGKAVVVNMPIPLGDRSLDGGKMVFRCNGGGDCAVAEIWQNGVGGARSGPKSAVKPVVVDAGN